MKEKKIYTNFVTDKNDGKLEIIRRDLFISHNMK